MKLNEQIKTTINNTTEKGLHQLRYRISYENKEEEINEALKEFNKRSCKARYFPMVSLLIVDFEVEV